MLCRTQLWSPWDWISWESSAAMNTTSPSTCLAVFSPRLRRLHPQCPQQPHRSGKKTEKSSRRRAFLSLLLGKFCLVGRNTLRTSKITTSYHKQAPNHREDKTFDSSFIRSQREPVKCYSYKCCSLFPPSELWILHTCPGSKDSQHVWVIGPLQGATLPGWTGAVWTVCNTGPRKRGVSRSWIDAPNTPEN